jgi:hypothetical protein
MRYYTSNANKISNLAIAYIVIEPLFNLYDFRICWIMPNSNIFNGQFFQVDVNGVGPFATTTQTIWAIIVGADLTMSANNRYDLFATASLPNTTCISFRISTISPTSFFITTVLIEVFTFNSSLASSPRYATFSTAEVNSLASYTSNTMTGFNTIYGIRTFHTVNQDFLNYMWNLTGTTLSVTSTNAFQWVGFSYLILQFITCSPSTPFLLVATNTCYDIVPVRYYADEYNEMQSCLYDCYTCASNTQCASCSDTIDFRTIDTGTNRCVPLSGYYDNGVTTAVVCPSLCLTCTSASNCQSCKAKAYPSGTSCLSCMANCDACTSGTNCQTCSTNYVFQSTSCIVNCNLVTNCATCTLSGSTVTCSTCNSGYSVSGNTCIEVCGNNVKTPN